MYVRTALFVSDLVENQEDRVSHDADHIEDGIKGGIHSFTFLLKFRLTTLFKTISPKAYVFSKKKTSSPKGNDAHLRAIIQSEKKWKHQFFRRLRAANSVVHGRIWPNFKLIQALMYVIITCKYEKDPIKNNREKVAKPFFKL